MSELFKFMSESPFLSFFIVLIVLAALQSLFVTLPNILLRHRNIRLHGYPPSHCDADGAFKDED